MTESPVLHAELAAALPEGVSVSDILGMFHRAGWRPGADSLVDRYRAKSRAANARSTELLEENSTLRAELHLAKNPRPWRPDEQATFDGAGIINAIAALQEKFDKLVDEAPEQAWAEGYYAGRNHALLEDSGTRPEPRNPYMPVCKTPGCIRRKHANNGHKDANGKTWWAAV